MEKTILTEKCLEQFGFTGVEDERYINGTKWLLQVSDHYIEEGEAINRDGTWFDAIGTFRYRTNGQMSVHTLCRGNYVCRSIHTEEDLKLLFLALTGKELIKKSA